MGKYTITITFEVNFRHGETAYCIFGRNIREVKVAEVFCNCKYDINGDGATDKTLEYKVYDEGMRCYYIISEFKMFASHEDAETYLNNAQ